MASNIYKIPKRYYIDHVECDCEAPDIIKETKTHYVISSDETPELEELRSRANYYIAMAEVGGWESYLLGVVTSAKATIKIIGETAGDSHGH